MAYLHRVVVALALSVVCLLAHAYTCTQYAMRTQLNTANSATGWFPSKLEAAITSALMYAAQQRSSSPGCSQPESGSPGWTYGNNCQYGGSAFGAVSSDGLSGEVWESGPTFATRIAFSGQFGVRTGDYCTYRCYVNSGQTWSTAPHWSASGVGDTKTLCIPNVYPGVSDGKDGCQVTTTATQCWTVGGATQCQGSVKYNGVDCNSSQPVASSNVPIVNAPTVTPTQASSTSCNGYFGQVNGVDTCVQGVAPSGVTSSVSSSTTSTTGTGTITSGTTTNSTQCDPSTQTCSTTTVTVNNNGSSTTNVTQQSQGEYCKGNASSAICGGDGAKPSTFGGSCAADFVCTGDAAMCASAKAANKIHCDFSASTTATDTALAAAKAASASAVPGTTETIGGSSFSTADLGITSACIADKSITVMGSTFVVELSRVCPALGWIGTAGQAVAMLLAMFIVFRRTS